MTSNLLPITYYLLPLVLSIPLGLALAKTTKDEKQIYTKYFQILLPILAILSAIFHLLSITYYLLPNAKTIAFTLTFTFITTLVWHKA